MPSRFRVHMIASTGKPLPERQMFQSGPTVWDFLLYCGQLLAALLAWLRRQVEPILQPRLAPVGTQAISLS